MVAGRSHHRERAGTSSHVEDVIDAVRHRIGWYQITRFACEENNEAIEHLTRALEALHKRAADREKREVEETHAT